MPRERLASSGLDLLAPLPVGLYNQAVPEAFRLPDFGRPDRLALVIGNTRVLWERFREALGRDPGLAAEPDPLDLYVEQAVRAAFADLPERWHARFAPEAVALQRAAELAGLAWLSPAHLSVHPVYGPWIALRALVVVDRPGPPPPPPPEPCPSCARGCEPAHRRAAEAGWGPTTWPLWLAVRDACPRGREHRYPEDALRYHYTKDRSALPG